MIIDSNKVISKLMLFIYSIWVIVPSIYHTTSVVVIAAILLILLLLMCVGNQDLKTKFTYLTFGMISLALMYFFVAYPLDLKHMILVVMEQFMMFVPMILAYNAMTNYTRKEIVFFIVIIIALELYVGYSTYSELQSNPMIARMLTSGVSEESKDISYRLANIGGYGTIYSFIFVYLSGLIAVLYAKKNIIKIVSVMLCIFSFYILIEAQFGTAIMLLILVTVLVIIFKTNSLQMRILVMGAGILGIFILPLLLNLIAEFAGPGILNDRLTAISGVLQNKSTNDVDLVLRQQLLIEGFHVFFKSPIWGQMISNNGEKIINLYSHSSYLDLACATGIIGLGIYLRTWSFANKMLTRCLKDSIRKFYFPAYAVFFVLGMMNPNWAVYQINVIAFLCFPLILYVLQDEDSINNNVYFVKGD